MLTIIIFLYHQNFLNFMILIKTKLFTPTSIPRSTLIKMKVFQGRLVHCRKPVVNEEGKREFRIEILERTAIGINDEGTVRVACRK